MRNAMPTTMSSATIHLGASTQSNGMLPNITKAPNTDSAFVSRIRFCSGAESAGVIPCSTRFRTDLARTRSTVWAGNLPPSPPNA